MAHRPEELKTGPQVAAISKVLKISDTSASGKYALTELPVGFYPLIIENSGRVRIMENRQLKDFKDVLGMAYIENNETNSKIDRESEKEWCDAEGMYDFGDISVVFMTTNCTVQIENGIFSRRPHFIIVPSSGFTLPDTIDGGAIEDLHYDPNTGIFTFTMPSEPGTITIFCPAGRRV